MAETPTRRAVLVFSAAVPAVSVAPVAAANAEAAAHRLAVQVDSNDPAIMNLALNNIKNVVEHYSRRGEAVEIELITFGPGVHMLREDNSPVLDRLRKMKEAMPNLTLAACGNTRAGMKRVEGRDIPLMTEAVEVPSGVVRLMELQEKGWSYIRP